jgi:hypothetical protein
MIALARTTRRGLATRSGLAAEAADLTSAMAVLSLWSLVSSLLAASLTFSATLLAPSLLPLSFATALLATCLLPLTFAGALLAASSALADVGGLVAAAVPMFPVKRVNIVGECLAMQAIVRRRANEAADAFAGLLQAALNTALLLAALRLLLALLSNLAADLGLSQHLIGFEPGKGHHSQHRSRGTESNQSAEHGFTPAMLHFLARIPISGYCSQHWDGIRFSLLARHSK